MCAMKVMEMTEMNDLDKHYVHKEAKVLEGLNHPNIVRFLDVYTTEE
jgi:hypothetical protein